MGVSFWILVLGCAVSIGSLAIGQPWTTALAKRSTPPEVWKTPLFRETNLVLTGIWAFVFMLAAFAAARSPLWAHIGIALALTAFGYASPRLGHWYANRRLAALGLTPPQ